MRINNEKKLIWSLLKTIVLISVALVIIMPWSAANTNYEKIDKVTTFVDNIKAYTKIDIGYVDGKAIFTIENPDVDFEVVDAEPFDGIGDNGPYATFNDALLGTIGECRSMAEFDLSSFSVPPGELISLATFEVIITSIDIYGLGVNGETPESMVVDGYVGNGLAELSDFQAGDGNVLCSVDTPNPQVGDILIFDVTEFVIDVVNAQEQYLGLTVRAGTFGGLWLTEGGVYPKLTIETISEPESDLNCEGSLSWDDVSTGSTVEGSFEVSNIGEEGSELDWEIIEWPEWGEWSFLPSSGTGLTPGDGPVTVEVEVIAPDESNTEFAGELKIVNCDNPSDYCTIPVYLKTPLNQPLNRQQILKTILKQFL